MKVQLELTLKADPNLIEVIHDLTSALNKSHSPARLAEPESVCEPPATDEAPPEATDSPSEATDDEQPPAIPKTAKEQKVFFTNLIKELGGEPPAKGHASTFRKAYEELKKEQENKTPVDEEYENAQDFPQDEEGNYVYTDDDSPVEVNHDSVRKLAQALLKKHSDNRSIGTTKLGDALRKVKADNITSADQDQLNQLVKLLEKQVGKTLAEVIAESDD